MEEHTVDLLDRQSFIDQIFSIIDNLPTDKKEWAFAINGVWGCGKSWVLDEFEKQVQDRCLIIHYNAWKNDFYEEPLIAILSTIADELNDINRANNSLKGISKEVLNIASGVIFGLIGKLSKNLTGVDIVEVARNTYDTITKSTIEQEINIDFDERLVLKSTIQKVKEQLRIIAEKVKIIIIVDELDRCLPDYAIKVLERLHHVFEELKNSVQILAVDKEQLNYTIERIFGENKAKEYLCKFIDFEIQLPVGTLNDKYEEKYDSYLKLFNNSLGGDRSMQKDFIDNMFKDIDIRQKIKLLERAELIHRLFVIEICDFSVMMFEIMMIVLLNHYNIKKECIFTTSLAVDRFIPNYFTNNKRHEEDFKCSTYVRGFFKDIKTNKIGINNEFIQIVFTKKGLEIKILFSYIEGISDTKRINFIFEEGLKLKPKDIDLNLEYSKSFLKGLDIIK